MKIMSAIFIKQLNDVFKNPVVTLSFILMPGMAFLMRGLLDLDYDTTVFAGVAFLAAMSVAFMPISIMASYISEDIETRSLRFLVMAGVKPGQYLLGLSSFVLLIASLSMLAMGFIGELSGGDLLLFLVASLAGLLPATALGALLGIVSKNVQQGMTLGSLVGLFLSFLPMFAMVNENIMNVTNFLFSQQIANIFNYIAFGPPTYMVWSLTRAFVIIGINFVVFASLFIVVYKKRGMNLD